MEICHGKRRMEIMGRDSSVGWKDLSFPSASSSWNELPVRDGREFPVKRMRRHLDEHLTDGLYPLGHWMG